MMKREDDAEGLLPGIPEEVVLSHIAPKIPWRASRVMSCVSHGWQNAFRSRQVHDARVASRSTETLIVVSHFAEGVCSIYLYSLRDKSLLQLPGMPQFQGGVPRACKVAVVDGKLYVLGGAKHTDTGLYGSEDMYVVDLAGQGKWQQCASMKEGRKRFGCTVLDMKIYVFGGISDWDPVPVSEVYDSEIDSWSSIPPLPDGKDMRFEHQVGTIGGELYLFMGNVHLHTYERWKETRLSLDEDPFCRYTCTYVSDVDVYNPSTRRWRVIDPYPWNEDDFPAYNERLFIAAGNFYAVGPENVYRLHFGDVEGSVWTDLQTASPPIEKIATVDELPTLAVDDQLFVVAHWEVGGEEKLCLLQCQGGFGGDDEEIKWEKANCSLTFEKDEDVPFLCQIEL